MRSSTSSSDTTMLGEGPQTTVAAPVAQFPQLSPEAPPRQKTAPFPARALPTIPFGRMWLVSVLLLAVVIAGAESWLRHNRYQPSVNDGAGLWGLQRHRLESSPSENTIVILGGSRAQLGIDPDILAGELPGSSVVLLAVDGSSAIPALRDIAKNSRFQGTVLLDFSPSIVFWESNPIQQEYAEQYHRVHDNLGRINAMANYRISMWLQSRLVTCNMSPLSVGKNVLSPNPPYSRCRPDRYRRSNYYLRGPDWLDQHRRWRIGIMEHYTEALVVDYGAWEARMREIGVWVREIQDRGGGVVLVRMPTTGRHMELDELSYPRRLFWDRVGELLGAPTMHFQDVPGLNGFECPDTSHLNWDDAIVFTRNLAGHLKAEGLLPPGD